MAGTPSPVSTSVGTGGPLVDALALINAVLVAVDRQVVSLGDPSNWASQAAVLNNALAVGGTVPDGLSAVGQLANLMGGADANSAVQTILVDQLGHLQADIVAGDGTSNTADNPNYQTLVGDSTGDFAGVSILDEVVAGNLGFAIQPMAPGQKPSSKADCVVVASDQSQDLMVSGQGMALNAVLFNVDTVAGAPASFHSFYCEVDIPLGWTAGAFIFEGSNTGLGTWDPITVFDDAVTTGTTINTAITPAANTQRFFSGAATYRYIRLRISTVFAGSYLQAVCRFSSVPYIPHVMAVGQATTANLQTTATQAGTWTVQVGNTANTTPILATPCPSTSATAALSSLNVNASGALTALKGSVGNLHGFSILNNTASPVFLSFWNVAVGSVTLGTTAPTMVFCIPASGTLTVNSDVALMNGASAMSYAAVTAYNGSTTASVTGSIFYK